MKILKRSMAMLLALIICFSVVAVAVEAVSVTTTNSNYGYMIPTNAKFTKTVSTVKLYGSYDYINFYINSEYDNRYFFYEIYSDKKYTKLVTGDVIECDEGAFTWSPLIKLKGVFKSGTYYCITYAAKIDSKGNATIANSSVATFKLVVDRTTDFTKQVVLLKSSTNTVNGPKITWYKHSSAATKYTIYRRSLSGTKWTTVGSTNGSTLTFTDKSVKDKNGKYVYTVKAFNKKGQASRYQFSGVTVLFAKTPVINSVATVVDNAIQIKWNSTSNSTYYRLYRKTNGGNWEIIKDKFYNNSYTDKNIVSGNNYQYTVRAYINTSDGKAISSYYPGKAVNYVAAPKLIGVDAVENGVKVDWEASVGATAYTVYRRPLDLSEGWTNLGEVSADAYSFIDETVEENASYRYTVRSEGKGVRGSYSKLGIDYVILAQPVVITTTNEDGFTLKWSKIPYADYYNIYYKNANGIWEKYDDTYSCTYTTKPKKCMEYQFTVSAVRGNYESTFNEDVESVVYWPKTYTYLNIYKDYNFIFWSSTSIEEYNLYKKKADSEDSEYELIYSGNDTYYKDTDVKYNVAYTYEVRALYNGAEQKEKLIPVTKIRYNPADYIKSYKVSEKFYNNGTSFYEFDYDLTDSATGMEIDSLCYQIMGGASGWDSVDMRYPDSSHISPADEEARFSLVVYDFLGSTPMDACVSVVSNEKCEKPKLKYRAVKDGVELYWDAVEGAAEYKLSLAESWRFHSDYELVVEANGSKTYSVLISGEEYDEKIGFDEWNNSSVLMLEAVHVNGNVTEGNELDLAYSSENPAIVMVSEVENGVEVRFGDYYGGGYYTIFRKVPGENSWTKLATVSGDFYLDKTAQKGVKYTYTVRKYDINNSCYASYYDTKGLSVGKIITPKLTSIENVQNGVTVRCEPIEHVCVNYVLYRRTETGSWEKIGTSVAREGYANNGITDRTAKSGVKYYYTMRATYCSNKSGFDATGLSVLYLSTPTLTSATRSSSGITVKWGKVTGADGYYVYRKTSGSGWSRVGTVKDGSTIAFKDTTAKTGTTYYYTVKAYSGSSTSAYVKNGIKCS